MTSFYFNLDRWHCGIIIQENGFNFKEGGYIVIVLPFSPFSAVFSIPPSPPSKVSRYTTLISGEGTFKLLLDQKSNNYLQSGYHFLYRFEGCYSCDMNRKSITGMSWTINFINDNENAATIDMKKERTCRVTAATAISSLPSVKNASLLSFNTGHLVVFRLNSFHLP